WPTAQHTCDRAAMEKYSRWSDLTTGINPFVPHKQRLHGNVLVKGLQLLPGTLLALVRTVLVAALALLLVLTNVITSVLGFVPFFGRLLKRLVEGLLCSLILLVLGVMVTAEDANTRRLGLTSTPKGVATGVKRGDVIVCNHTTFLEVLYLARRFSPVFVYVTQDGAAKGVVHACGLIEALYRSLAMPVISDNDASRKLVDVVARASGPVVVFPEGARSNGKSVLKFLPILEHLPFKLPGGAPLRLHLLAFRYEFNNFSPSHSAGSGWAHFFWTSSRVYHSMRATLLPASQLNVQELTATTGRGKSPVSTTVAPAQVERLRGLLAAMLRTKPVDLSVPDFVSFNAYWNHVTSGGRKAASEFTDRKAPHEHAQWTTKR
ncbi:TPA: hypothetical protein N0F65_011358, partial [Lagenidium giganteum]